MELLDFRQTEESEFGFQIFGLKIFAMTNRLSLIEPNGYRLSENFSSNGSIIDSSSDSELRSLFRLLLQPV